MSSKRVKNKQNICSKNSLRSNQILNTDVLTIILKQLKIKQLFRLERVSKQFTECVNQVLETKTGLRIGPKDQFRSYCEDKGHGLRRSDITNAFLIIDNNYDLIGCEAVLSSILRKCLYIKCLYLSECSVDSQIVELISDNCPQLQCLFINNIYCYKEITLWKTFGRLFSKRLIHLYVDCNCSPLIRQMNRNTSNHNHYHKAQHLTTEIDIFVKELTALEKLVISDYRKSLNKLIKALPQTIKSLYLKDCHKLDENLINCLISLNQKCLTELKIDIYIYNDYDYETEVFNYICDNLKLKKLSYCCRQLTHNSIAKLSQLSDLQKLKIEYVYNSFMNLKDIQINRLLSINCLHFENCSFKPKMLTKFSKEFPNVKKLSLKIVNFVCECNDTENETDSEHQNYDFCNQCYSKCVSFISQLKQLKHLSIHFDCNDIKPPLIEGLVEFKSLTTLELPWFPFDQSLLEKLINSCNKIIESQNNSKAFILKIDKEIVDQLISIDESCVLIPNNLRIFSVFN